VNDRDQYHEVARSLLTECFEQRLQLLTTTWVAFEALSMLKSRAGWQVVADLWSLLTDPLAVDLVRITEDIESRALDLFFSFQDKTWGVVDCASFIVMEDTECWQAIGFDHHFVEASRQRGFEVLPGIA
jgi:predicted nucleic acid-binding protein